MKVLEDNFNLPVHNGRKSTDILFAILLTCCWIAMTLIGLAALGYRIGGTEVIQIQQGNPDLLIRGVDYEGNICGVSEIVKDNKYAWNPNLSGTNKDSTGVLVPIFFSVCVSSCPLSGDIVKNVYGTYGSWISSSDTHASSILYYCVSSDSTASQTMDTSLLIFRNFVEAATVIGLAGFCLAVIVSLLFLLVIRIPCVLRMTVWLCIYLVLALLIAGGYTLIVRSRGLSCTSGDYECKIEVHI